MAPGRCPSRARWPPPGRDRAQTTERSEPIDPAPGHPLTNQGQRRGLRAFDRPRPQTAPRGKKSARPPHPEPSLRPAAWRSFCGTKPGRADHRQRRSRPVLCPGPPTKMQAGDPPDCVRGYHSEVISARRCAMLQGGTNPAILPARRLAPVGTNAGTVAQAGAVMAPPDRPRPHTGWTIRQARAALP